MPAKADYSAMGSLPPPTGRRETTPCHMNKDFHALERDLAEALRRLVSRSLRSIKVHEIENEVAAKFCDGCWFKDQCRQWADSDENFEGLAAGRAYFEFRDAVMPLEHAKLAEEQRRCKCHDEPMSRNGIDRDTGRVSWRCAVRGRARERAWRNSEGGRAYYATRDPGHDRWKRRKVNKPQEGAS